MKINIELNRNSIANAVAQLKRIKRLMPQMKSEFYMQVAQWLTNRANTYIDLSDIGENVKSSIKASWRYEPIANGIKITNDSEKAVFVEFGVGVVGQGDAHPRATAEGYEYNVDSQYKDRQGSGTWVFKSTLENLDLPKNNIEFAYNQSESEYAIVTRGAKGVWYAYNAIVDAQMDLQNPNGEIATKWKRIKERYIG